MFSFQGIMFVIFKNYFYKTIFGEDTDEETALTI